jgi:RNA polymerase sigma-70 factor (ECF subfamily)
MERGARRLHPTDESSALRGLRELDPQAIGAVYDQYFPQIFRYILFRVADRQSAEDLASDVFVRLLEALNRSRGPDVNLKGWLFATASHAVNDHHRRAYRRPLEELLDALPDTSSEVQADYDERERRRNVRNAYQGLTEEQQHVLALRFGQGYSLEETAGLMDKQVNAIKSLQFRALAALQREIGEVEHEGAD